MTTVQHAIDTLEDLRRDSVQLVVTLGYGDGDRAQYRHRR